MELLIPMRGGCRDANVGENLNLRLPADGKFKISAAASLIERGAERAESILGAFADFPCVGLNKSSTLSVL